MSQESGENVYQFVSRLCQQAVTCEFGIKCYSNHLHKKFLEKEGTITFDELLWVVRSQEAGDQQLRPGARYWCTWLKISHGLALMNLLKLRSHRYLAIS